MSTQALFQLTKTATDFPRVKITSSTDAHNVIRQYYSGDIEVYESFFILLVDRSNTTVGYAKISQGGIAGTVVDVKIVAKYCLDSLCSGVVLAHNHPSGNLRPSVQDEQITKKVIGALELIDVNVLDHLILTADSYYSFKDEGNIL
jgi:DNA repair protein RadC